MQQHIQAGASQQTKARKGVNVNTNEWTADSLQRKGLGRGEREGEEVRSDASDGSQSLGRQKLQGTGARSDSIQ